MKIVVIELIFEAFDAAIAAISAVGYASSGLARPGTSAGRGDAKDDGH
ncbi:hypothetical protein [Sphingomonas bacterium]|nr:hypothetical protein [Sphingomonas bacterium]